MTEKPTRRRRRTLLVPLLGIGVAAWAVRSRLAERGTLHDGWQPLPPRRVTPDRTAARVASRSRTTTACRAICRPQGRTRRCTAGRSSSPTP